jgi:hypothetical protein
MFDEVAFSSCHKIAIQFRTEKSILNVLVKQVKNAMAFTKCYKFMEMKQCVEYKFLCGLKDFKSEGKTF